MRASTSTSPLASLTMLLLSIMTISTVQAIPPPELLATSSDSDPATSIGAPNPSGTLSVAPPDETNSTNSTSNSTSTPHIADSINGNDFWVAGCIQHDHLMGDLKPAKTNRIWDGITHLRRTPGDASTMGHPICGRVSCSYGSAIWWCNENAKIGVTVPDGYVHIADGAEAIVNRCDTGGLVMGKATTGWNGYTGEKAKYSVVVTGDDC